MSEHVPGNDSEARAQARRERLRDLMDRLERVLAEPAGQDTSVWRANVAIVCDDLDDALAEHISETEEEFFGELLERAPQLDHRVERMRAEHPDLVDGLNELRAVLTSDAPSDDLVPAVREKGVDLLARLIHHRQAGADLLYDAYWVDVASAD